MSRLFFAPAYLTSSIGFGADRPLSGGSSAFARLMPLWAAALLLFLLPGMSLAASGTLPLPKILGHVQDRYEHITDLQADFVHTVPVALTGSTVREKGIFSFKKPLRLRWEYRDPSGKLMVVNPDAIWLYLPDDGTAYRRDTEHTPVTQLAARFLAGLERIEEDFSVSFADPPRDDKGNYRITLVPRKSAAGLQSLTLFIDEEQFLLTGYTLTDLYGAANRYSFSNISVNTGLADSLFHFEPPAGVRVEELP